MEDGLNWPQPKNILAKNKDSNSNNKRGSTVIRLIKRGGDKDDEIDDDYSQI